MTDATPPEPTEDGEAEAKLYAKRRMPYEADAEAARKRHPGVIAAAVLYVVMCLGCIALGLFMHFRLGHDWLTVAVLAPFLGAIWFAIRIAMTLSPNAHALGQQDEPHARR